MGCGGCCGSFLRNRSPYTSSLWLYPLCPFLLPRIPTFYIYLLSEKRTNTIVTYKSITVTAGQSVWDAVALYAGDYGMG